MELKTDETSISNSNLTLDLLSLHDTDRQKLVDAIRKTNGTIQLWIHPHYEEEKEPSFQEEGNDYKRGRHIAFTANAKTEIPILTLLETEVDKETSPSPQNLADGFNRYKEFFLQLREQDIARNNTLPIITLLSYRNDPTPIMDDAQTGEIKTKWDSFTGVLHDLGVKQIIIRGRDLYLYRNPDKNKLSEVEKKYLEDKNEDVLPRGCVGFAIVNLATRGFKIRESRLTYPRMMNEIPIY